MKLIDKVIGYETVKKELYQIIDMFKNKELYEKMDAKLPKGLLIHGKPGMGKSTLANALIEECNVKSFTIKNNKEDKEIIDEINQTFKAASEEKASIIFIDDIDKFSEQDKRNIDDKIFISIQTAIDSVKNSNVFVVATANNISKLPDSLKRNGRFDIVLSLKRPTYEDARKIIEFYMKNKCVNPNLDYDDVAKMISYTSCADLETILNESAIHAAYNRKDSIDINDIVKAYLKDRFNSPEENPKCIEEEIMAVAMHEAGHATVSEVLKEGSVGFACVNTTDSNNINGFTHLCHEFKRRQEVILVGLGGKAAVEMYLEGKCGSGCQQDLYKVMNVIKDGITENGTCGLGMVSAYCSIGEPVSESLRSRYEAVVYAELERYMFIVKDILIKNKDLLMKITQKLKEKNILLHSDIKEIRNSVKIIEAKGI